MAEWLEMQHEVHGGTARVTRDAFNAVWSKRGWTLVGETQAVPESPDDTTDSEHKEGE